MHIIHFILYILCCSMYIILHIYIYKDTMGTYIAFYFSIFWKVPSGRMTTIPDHHLEVSKVARIYQDFSIPKGHGQEIDVKQTSENHWYLSDFQNLNGI